MISIRTNQRRALLSKVEPLAARKLAPKSNWPRWKIDEALYLARNGYSCSQIGMKLGVTKNAVSGILFRNRQS